MLTNIVLSEINITNIEEIIILSILSIIMSIIAYVLSPKIAKFFSKYSEEMDSETLLHFIRFPLTYSFLYIGIWFLIGVANISESSEELINSIGLTIAVVIWSRTLYMIGKKIIKSIVRYRYDENIVPIALNIWTLSTIIFGILFLFEVWNINITPILASAGVFGIIVGLAARETISNFFGSIALYADNTYQKGDYIRLEESESEGFVKDISIRSTELRTLDNNVITIPNSQLHQSIIENRSEPSDSQRIELEVGVSYDEVPNEIRDLISESIDTAIEERQNVATNTIRNHRVFVKDFGDNAIIYRIFIWITHPTHDPIVRDEIQDIIYEELNENDIEIPYPQRSINIKSNRSDNDKESGLKN